MLMATVHHQPFTIVCEIIRKVEKSLIFLLLFIIILSDFLHVKGS